MVVLFIIMIAGILLFFLFKPPLQPNVDSVFENATSVDLNLAEIACVKGIDA